MMEFLALRSAVDAATILLMVVGAAFFLLGTLGILRLPDIFSRLHALTKADNLGLGFIIAGLALQAPSVFVAAKLLVIWLVALLSAATVAQLVAVHCRRQGSDREDGAE